MIWVSIPLIPVPRTLWEGHPHQKGNYLMVPLGTNIQRAQYLIFEEYTSNHNTN